MRQLVCGYKQRIDVADGQIPISCVLSAASLHDSQVAIALATLTSQRVTSLYALMDAAYDAQDIREHCESLGQLNRDLSQTLKIEVSRTRKLRFGVIFSVPTGIWGAERGLEVG